MRHFYRTHLRPAEVIQSADAFFDSLGLKTVATALRARTFQGVVGTPEVQARLKLTVKPEGGHYTFVEVHTDQMGESRLDRNVKRFFVQLARQADPRHLIEAAY
ncbi:MAG: hypothetical protein Q8K82_19900 [Gemmatimonadaceae bacterium]|nr:hypothetical protein [Gemmatimonadaceae bacterium]